MGFTCRYKRLCISCLIDRLAFLDLMLIIDCNNNRLEITVYRKVALRRVYSFHQLFVRLPFKVDLSLPNTIYAVIGLYFTMVHEIEGLKIMSMMNG